MRQDDYEILLACIQYGAPALSSRLVQSLNNIIEKANELNELKRQMAEEERKGNRAVKPAKDNE